MKTKLKKLNIAAALLLSSAVLMASSPYEENNNTDYLALKKEIRKQVSFPIFEKHTNPNENVTVIFKVSENGTLSIVTIQSDNPSLKEYVTGRLKKLRVSCGYAKEVVYKIDIHFKIL